MTVQRAELMSGVRLTAIQSRQAQSTFWGLHLIAPLRRETAALNALLPGVLRLGCQSRPAREDVDAALKGLGGSIWPSVRACGTYQCFGFTAAFPESGHLYAGNRLAQEAAGLLGELLLRPVTKNGRLLAGNLEAEQRRLTRVLEEKQRDLPSFARASLLRQMCAGEALSVPPTGELEEIQAVAINRLFRQYQEMLARCPVELYYCGSRPLEDIIRIWRAALAGLPRGRLFSFTPPVPLPHPGQAEPPQCFWEEWADGGGLALGFRTAVSLGDPVYPALLTADALFDRTLPPETAHTLDGHSGLMTIVVRGECAQSEASQARLLSRLETIQSSGFTEDDLSTAKKALTDGLRALSAQPKRLEEYWFHRAVAQEFLSPEDLAELIGQVTAGQAAAAAQEILLDSICRLTGPDN